MLYNVYAPLLEPNLFMTPHSISNTLLLSKSIIKSSVRATGCRSQVQVELYILEFRTSVCACSVAEVTVDHKEQGEKMADF